MNDSCQPAVDAMESLVLADPDSRVTPRDEVADLRQVASIALAQAIREYRKAMGRGGLRLDLRTIVAELKRRVES